ncbi:outer membrane lipoprotein, partial [Azospirillum isscasi]
MTRTVMFGLPAAVIAAGILAGCTPNYSPNTYAASATQQANKVERAVVIGFRQVKISTNGTVGAVTGGAAGGVLGSQSGTIGLNAALGAVGGTAIGSLLGTSIEHVTGDTTGWEYIVRKPDGELLSVTQREEKPIEIGQKVLVIAGSQARIVADYSVAPEPEPAPAAKETVKEAAKDEAKDEAKPADTVEAKELPAPAPADTAAPAPAESAPAGAAPDAGGP